SADAKVLDVGCGQALLRSWLPGAARYKGIEPSVVAVRNAYERDASLTITLSRAEDYVAPSERFDSVVFNEVLYYTRHPIRLLKQYSTLLSSHGVVPCSIYQSPRRRSLQSAFRHMLDRRRPMSNVHCERMVRTFMKRRRWTILDDRTVSAGGIGDEWHIWTAQPN